MIEIVPPVVFDAFVIYAVFCKALQGLAGMQARCVAKDILYNFPTTLT